MTLEELFKGAERHLAGARKVHRIRYPTAKEVAEDWIYPVMDIIERNAGQRMDPVFVAYMIEYEASMAKPLR